MSTVTQNTQTQILYMCFITIVHLPKSNKKFKKSYNGFYPVCYKIFNVKAHMMEMYFE